MQRTTYNPNHDKHHSRDKTCVVGMQKKQTIMTMSIENVFMKKVGYVWAKVDFTCQWQISGGTEGAR